MGTLNGLVRPTGGEIFSREDLRVDKPSTIVVYPTTCSLCASVGGRLRRVHLVSLTKHERGRAVGTTFVDIGNVHSHLQVPINCHYRLHTRDDYLDGGVVLGVRTGMTFSRIRVTTKVRRTNRGRRETLHDPYPSVAGRYLPAASTYFARQDSHVLLVDYKITC